ncbi:hypothetical protein KGF54_000457 [Candida jiufengensis]|uniref:uncharacterized protein n=1 Tax=Candida jiufengensis TaxID=497108 RepID=UPI002224E307|nr:uncharacterized protein KGF54_000457 [Candida jiufengensis]KAI5956839.1 hypothetical protein KGF54_000457 [Candida jiufengensis]
MDDNNYSTTYESSLAVVATAMKKARLSLDVLLLNSILGGMVFSTGGMLHLVVGASISPELLEKYPAILQILSGICYPIGLFYVVILGLDLFNSNILFFSCAIMRNAVSIFDLVISWLVSYCCNLVGNIFVCYIISHYSGVTDSENFYIAAQNIVELKASYSFVQNLLKGIVGNFYVCLAIYLQIMVKPMHVKYIMMVLPVFTFVALGFTHTVADMYMLIIGKINHSPIPLSLICWKIFVPETLGNIIGGSFFGIVLCWYLHIYVVERDQKLLHLPQYELRDEQPDLNQDSRVVRQKKPQFQEDEIDESSEESDESVLEELHKVKTKEKDPLSRINSEISDESFMTTPSNELQPLPFNRVTSNISNNASFVRRRSTTNSISRFKSPKNVFPVYGMGPPSARERKIAEGNDNTKFTFSANDINKNSAEYIGSQLKRMVTNKSRVSKRDNDLESAGMSRMRTNSRVGRRMSSLTPAYTYPAVSAIDISQITPTYTNNNRSGLVDTPEPNQATEVEQDLTEVSPKQVTCKNL